MEHLEKDNDMNDLQAEATHDQRKTVVLRLRELQHAKIGGPMPGWMAGPEGWGVALSKLAGEAADLLEDDGDAGDIIADLKAEIAGLERMMEDAGE